MQCNEPREFERNSTTLIMETIIDHTKNKESTVKILGAELFSVGGFWILGRSM